MFFKNTQSKQDYIIDTIIFTFVAMIWYKNLLFRCITNLTLKESIFLLWTIVTIFVSIGIVIRIKKYRNLLSTFINILFPYGIYTFLAYSSITKELITFSTYFIIALCAIYIIPIWKKRIKNTHKKKYILKKRLTYSLIRIQTIASIIMVVIIFFLSYNVLFGSSLMLASIEATISSKNYVQTLENNTDTLLHLEETIWENLSFQERLDVLQTVANIEAEYLGIPNELNVGASNLKENILGQYRDDTHEIIISLDSLMNDSAKKVLGTLCHEAYHSYQYRIVEVYYNADKHTQELKLFEKARSYLKEFSDYLNPDTNFEAYYQQECETDARNYAKTAVDKYYQYIFSNLGEN